MAIEVEIHRRQFTEDVQKNIRSECDNKRIIWRGFEDIDLIKREIENGQLIANTILPKLLHEHLRYKIDPFYYSISFYVSIGYECPNCDYLD